VAWMLTTRSGAYGRSPVVGSRGLSKLQSLSCLRYRANAAVKIVKIMFLIER
jgi:hypothetical protein